MAVGDENEIVETSQGLTCNYIDSKKLIKLSIAGPSYALPTRAPGSWDGLRLQLRRR